MAKQQFFTDATMKKEVSLENLPKHRKNVYTMEGQQKVKYTTHDIFDSRLIVLTQEERRQVFLLDVKTGKTTQSNFWNKK